MNDSTVDWVVKASLDRAGLLKILAEGEDIISGIEAQADNAGIDLDEARMWWIRAKKLVDSISKERPKQ